MSEERGITWNFRKIALMREKCPNCGQVVHFGELTLTDHREGKEIKGKAARCSCCKWLWVNSNAPNNFLTKDGKNWLVMIDLSD